MMPRFAILLAPLLAAACATLETPPQARECSAWFDALDAQVDAARVRDAQETRIRGHPYVRVNRLLASYREDAARDEGALQALVQRMQALDIAARGHEIANLGAGVPLERATVPDDYSTAMRVLGLYALTRWPFIAGVRAYQESVRAAFRAEPGTGTVLRYGPPEAPPLPRPALAAMMQRAAENPLGIPEPQRAALEALFAAHAPVFEIETAGAYDRPGALRWRAGDFMPSVNAAEPVVYRHLAWTRYRERALLQLVYTIWFSERPPESPGDILAGKLDGVTWRVTLAPDGAPLVYDSMHPCGCFHMFFPTPRALPAVADGERPVVRVASRTHYVQRVTLAQHAVVAARYALRPYDELRSLPRPEGGSASVFGPGDGLIAGTERPERLLFWPMGIASAGAMRQWGRHATAFVGRRHFDDADLLEKRFALDLR